MLRRIGQRELGLFLCALHGILTVGSAAAADELPIADAIDPPCATVAEYQGNPRAWQERQFPDVIRVDIAGSKQKAWIENLLRALLSRKRNIPPSARKNFDAIVSWEIDGQLCESSAKVRLNGDAKDHISYTGSTVISSLAVKLLEGNIGNAVRFKLLLPETRVGDREIIAIMLFREFGFIAPETRAVTGYLNGVETPYLFQESPAKEFLEANDLRESVLIEGDERWGWLMHSRPDVYSERLVHDAVWVENRSFGRIDNKGWIDNPTSMEIAIAGLTTANKLYHQYHVDKPSRTGDEYHLGMSSSYRLDQNSNIIEGERLFVLVSKVLYASHGLRLHNRKFYFDPMYQRLKPIYYDGMPLRDKDNRRGRFPRNGLFPADEIDLVASTLADTNVRERVFRGLRARGGAMTREEFDAIMDAALERTLALEPRRSPEYQEPAASGSIDFDLLLSEETTGRYEFFGFRSAADSFQLCAASSRGGTGYSLECGNASIEPKKILSEPTAEDGDPIPFIGAFEQPKASELILSVPERVRQSRYVNPENLDIEIDTDELVIIDYTVDHEAATPPVIKAIVNSVGPVAGKIMVRGKVPAHAYFEVSGKNSGTEGQTRYDTRLLTGCLTFVDAELQDIRIFSRLGPCEDAVNFVRSDGSVKELVIENPLADAMDADFSNLDFQELRVMTSANDCIDFSAGIYRIDSLVVDGCGDKGVSAGEKAVVDIGRFEVREAAMGAAVKDSSYLSVDEMSFDSVGLCFAAYRKKQEFGGARLRLGQDPPEICARRGIRIQQGSALQIDK